jgi:pimeloyl-ACP methyl ester carboxylesterase
MTSTTLTLPEERGAHHVLRDGPGRWPAGLVGVVLVLLGAGAAYQVIATERDRRVYPPPGQLVDVGGYKLHLHTLGSANNGPTVILEGGAGLGSVTWAWVQPRVAQTTRVVAYDRAGVGWSDRGPEPRDAEQIATELHAALQAAGVGGPYVLVGHSFGGLYVRMFADRYPEEVGGLVFVDPTHPDQGLRAAREGEAMVTTRRVMRLFDALSHVGLLRLANPAAMFMPGLPAQQDAELRAYAATGFAAAAAAEISAIEDRTFPQVRRTRSLGDRPVAVLSAGQTVTQEPTFLELHQELAALSSTGTHRVVDGASHAGMVFDAGYAEATVAAIEDIVRAVRARSP